MMVVGGRGLHVAVRDGEYSVCSGKKKICANGRRGTFGVVGKIMLVCGGGEGICSGWGGWYITRIPGTNIGVKESRRRKRRIEKLVETGTRSLSVSSFLFGQWENGSEAFGCTRPAFLSNLNFERNWFSP